MNIRRLLWIAVICACGSLANAEIVWSGQQDYWFGGGGQGDRYRLGIDVDLDSIADFRLFATDNNFYLIPTNGSAALADPDTGRYAPVAAGASIEESTTHYEWLPDHELLAWMGGGGFLEADREFLGFSFEVSGATHYGWFRLSHNDVPMSLPGGGYQRSATLIIHDLAWETEPNKGIIAGAVPEPSSVFLVFLGAFTLWGLKFRKERRLAIETE